MKLYGANIENRKNDMLRSIHVFILNDTHVGTPRAIMFDNLASVYSTVSVWNIGTKTWQWKM